MDAHIQRREKSGQSALSYRFCACCWKYSTLPSTCGTVCLILSRPFDRPCPGFPTWLVSSMLNRKPQMWQIARRMLCEADACARVRECGVCTCVHVCVWRVHMCARACMRTCLYMRSTMQTHVPSIYHKHTYAQEHCDVLHQYLFTPKTAFTTSTGDISFVFTRSASFAFATRSAAFASALSSKRSLLCKGM